LKDYVLRIYRREKNDSRRFVGIVEEVGVNGNKAFTNLGELWEIRNPSKIEAAKTKRPKRVNKPNKLSEPNKLNKPEH